LRPRAARFWGIPAGAGLSHALRSRPRGQRGVLRARPRAQGNVEGATRLLTAAGAGKQNYPARLAVSLQESYEVTIPEGGVGGSRLPLKTQVCDKPIPHYRQYVKLT